MRISDWSSDVCSSDLILDHPEPLPLKRMGKVCPSEPTELWFRPFTKKKIADLTSEEVAALRVKAQERAVSLNKNVVPMKTHSYLDRKSVVEGKSVSVRVDLGGRRIIKKKKTTK